MPRVAELVGSGVSDAETTARSRTISDIRGVARLAIDAVMGVTDIVEDMHRNIASISPIIGASPTGSARGISGLVYQSVRGVTRTVGFGLDIALAQLAPLLAVDISWSGRDAVLAALNGVLGDHLAASGNPLAIPMRLHQSGKPLKLDSQALAARLEPAAGRLLVLVHGLCMNDLQWSHEGQDHGAALARDLGYTAIYLHYNSGRHISTNGRQFSDMMENLIELWPVPVSEIVIAGHSMGGLVARSACHYASLADHAWSRRVTKLVFLGTPHHGAPLERVGSWTNALIGTSPYTAPFARLGNIRSAGIRDLSEGYVTDAEWEGAQANRPRRSTPLPPGVQCFVIAATRNAVGPGSLPVGDGLVPLMSALGEHENPALTLPIPPGRRAVIGGLNHFDLLSSRMVYEQMKSWLADR